MAGIDSFAEIVLHGDGADASTTITGTLANAATLNANGVAIGEATPIVVPIGVIGVTAAVGATTGTWRHYIRYRPLARGVTVT